MFPLTWRNPSARTRFRDTRVPLVVRTNCASLLGAYFLCLSLSTRFAIYIWNFFLFFVRALVCFSPCARCAAPACFLPSFGVCWLGACLVELASHPVYLALCAPLGGAAAWGRGPLRNIGPPPPPARPPPPPSSSFFAILLLLLLLCRPSLRAASHHITGVGRGGAATRKRREVHANSSTSAGSLLCGLWMCRAKSAKERSLS